MYNCNYYYIYNNELSIQSCFMLQLFPKLYDFKICIFLVCLVTFKELRFTVSKCRTVSPLPPWDHFAK